MGEETQRPKLDDDYDKWKAYWAALAMPWRVEPEIDRARQEYLQERRAIKPDTLNAMYPFRDGDGRVPLERADVEWLLATHESDDQRGPVVWEAVPTHLQRWGLDLRGADLRDTDLSGLPLSRLRAGLDASELAAVPRRKRLAAAFFAGADMVGADLSNSQLRGATFANAALPRSNLMSADLTFAYLAAADMRWVHLEGADMYGAYLFGTDLRGAFLSSATTLNEAELSGIEAALDPVWVAKNLLDAIGNTLVARLVVLPLMTILPWMYLPLSPTWTDPPLLADVHFGGVNLTVLRWFTAPRLGDERLARAAKGFVGNRKEYGDRLDEFRSAVRAYRQVGSYLREQGTNEAADRFYYRAQLCQRQVFARQLQPLRYLGSLLLDVISGYGYRPLRSIVIYVVTIALFAFLYWCVTNDVSITQGVFTHVMTSLGMTPPPAPATHLQGYEAVVVSMTSFHGRGFFQLAGSPGDKAAILSAIEAAVGLLIEIVFIATFTQRFFAR